MIFDMESERKLSGVARTYVVKKGSLLGSVQSLDSSAKTCTRLTSEGTPFGDAFDELILVAPKGVPKDLMHLVPPEAMIVKDDDFLKGLTSF